MADDVRSCLSRQDADGALQRIFDFVSAVMADPTSTSTVFGSAALDRLCRDIGARSRVDAGGASGSSAQEGHAVWIASELYASGGHTGLLLDYIASMPDWTHTIVLTNVFDREAGHVVPDRVTQVGVPVTILAPGTFSEKIVALQRHLRELRPARVFLFNHHQDVIAIAGAQPELCGQLFLVHHCDHNIALGTFLPDCVHVDAHPMGFGICRDALGIANNVYLPLILHDNWEGGDPQRAFARNGALTTGTSGSSDKFAIPYRYNYLDVASDVLRITGGRHVHIGPLTEEQLLRVQAGLERAGVPPTSFVHIPHVPSVAKALVAEGVDVYISTFPIGGGRAAIEALSSGTPVIGHVHYADPIIGSLELLPDESFRWRTPDQLLEYVGTLDKDTLKRLSRISRAHYLKNYHPSILARQLNSRDSGRIGMTVLRQKPFQRDALQVYLDSQWFYREHWLDPLMAEHDALSKAHAKVSEQHGRLSRQNEALQAELAGVLNSASWRITAPLRWLVRRLRRLRN